MAGMLLATALRNSARAARAASAAQEPPSVHTDLHFARTAAFNSYSPAQLAAAGFQKVEVKAGHAIFAAAAPAEAQAAATTAIPATEQTPVPAPVPAPEAPAPAPASVPASPTRDAPASAGFNRVAVREGHAIFAQ